MRRHNPGGIDLNTLVLIGVAFYLLSKLGGKKDKPAECYVGFGPFTWDICAWGDEATGATPVGGTLPSGNPLNYAINTVGWDSFLGIVRAGNTVFHVELVHQGPADTPTIAVSLGNRQVGAIQITVPTDDANQSYKIDIPTRVEPGVYPISILVISGGPNGGVALNQAMLQTISVYP